MKFLQKISFRNRLVKWIDNEIIELLKYRDIRITWFEHSNNEWDKEKWRKQINSTNTTIEAFRAIKYICTHNRSNSRWKSKF